MSTVHDLQRRWTRHLMGVRLAQIGGQVQQLQAEIAAQQQRLAALHMAQARLAGAIAVADMVDGAGRADPHHPLEA